LRILLPLKHLSASDIIWRTRKELMSRASALSDAGVGTAQIREENMRETIVEFLSTLLSPQMVTFVVAMLPISELRGALPYALTAGKLPLAQAFPIAVLGNMVPVPFLMYLLEPGSRLLSRTAPGKRFVDWLFARTRARSEKVRKYELIGLVLFVAIPLPVTGAWTGTVAAYLCGLRKGWSLVAITGGVCIAGVVVSTATLGVKETAG